MSRAFIAAIARSTNLTFCSDIGLPPFLDEAFGGSTGFVDRGVVGPLRHDTARVRDHHRESKMDVGACATKPTRHYCGEPSHPVAEVVDFIGRKRLLVIRAVEVLNVAANRVPALESSDACQKDRVGSEEANKNIPAHATGSV